MVDFNSLKNNRKQSFENLTKKLASGGNNRQKDERYWQPTRDAAGNGSAIIRFLPAGPDGDEPYVTVYDHAFQNEQTGKWYIEKNLNTIGQADPCGELNQRLWKSGDQDQSRKQKRRVKYHANILVIKDPGAPENEGKTFIYAFGKKILDKITEVMQKTDDLDDDDKFNPFDLWDGANFRLRVQMVEGYPNYDKSKFEAPSPVSDDDDEIKKIWEGQHSLAFLTDPAGFKTYEELQARLNDVLGVSSPAPSRPAPQASQKNTSEEDESDLPWDSGSTSSSSDGGAEEGEDLEAWLKSLGSDNE